MVPTLGYAPSSLAFQTSAFTRLALSGKLIGAPGETRTLKIWLLRPTRIPIPSPGQINNFMTPHSEKPTVEILYQLFSKQEYKPTAYYCLPAEFVQTYYTIKKTFIQDTKPTQQDFVPTTIGAPTKN